jgi:hypothetical protein
VIETAGSATLQQCRVPEVSESIRLLAPRYRGAEGCKRLRPHPVRLGQAADEGYGVLGVQPGVMLRHVAVLMLSGVMIAAVWIVCCAM